ncbi:uncharacterized protein [Aegilops tauschii subsp. strangulata]|uniref:Uncharacterized protein n=1 Tax=Aegilops tauschii subsp. strangulata TaxID=200361 RepID=A0A453JKE3_AEGTS|nr:nucleolar protein dao-5 [Aegilops tauschii subsp. strangulata]XP_040244684.1 nucleolar protein dao-5 [Aegilops tauschii subsp. strangulata]XP_045084233.1 nucleolar protein dao-5 [Aegilops tauschii subsp. strangulata]
MSTNTNANPAPKDAEEKKAAGSSSSSSEHLDEDDDFFQIEGPVLNTQFSLAGPNLDGCPDPKRIPSSVFARTSTLQTDWSVTSNEALFSINVGNTSFDKDHKVLYGKSGEMGNPNEPLAPLPSFPKQSPGSSPIKGAVSPKATGEGSSTVKGEGDADHIDSISHRSEGSATNFAFPILAGDEKASGCSKDNQPNLAQQSTAQLSHAPEPEPHDEKNESPKAAMESPKAAMESPKAAMESPKAAMEAPKPEEAPVAEPAPAPAEPPPATKMFPCCSCCPFCC